MREGTLDPRLIAALGPTPDPAEVLTDPAALHRAGCDAFFEGAPPLAVLVPGTAEQLAGWLRGLAPTRIALVPQGATLSYSAGTIAPSGDWLAIDLRRLDRIVEINATDAFVRIEAGATWSALHVALEARGLRTPFWGPASGLYSTIGGGIATDAMFFGSAAYGSASASVLGVTVLLADGRQLVTGVRALESHTAGHPFGPDLTPLFIGSCGAFGVIVEATLRLIAYPRELRFAGFRCRSAEIAARALTDLATAHAASEVLLLDPSVTARLGSDSAADAQYSLSVVTEGVSAAEADRQMETVLMTGKAAGATHRGEGLLRTWRSAPFLPPAMLRDPRGLRWVPVHGVLPHSHILDGLRALDQCLTECMIEHASTIRELGLSWSTTCALIGNRGVLVEANLYWLDRGNALIDSFLGPADETLRLGGHWRRIEPLRAALARALAEVGATHLQLGRLYPYRRRLPGSSGEVLDALKQLFDPRGVMNPGALGLAGSNASASDQCVGGTPLGSSPS
jgi:FAD/FMN-containing dehydrogenase